MDSQCLIIDKCEVHTKDECHLVRNRLGWVEWVVLVTPTLSSPIQLIVVVHFALNPFMVVTQRPLTNTTRINRIEYGRYRAELLVT